MGRTSFLFLVSPHENQPKTVETRHSLGNTMNSTMNILTVRSYRPHGPYGALPCYRVLLP